MTSLTTPEHKRLAASESRQADWKKWGPYLSERAWGTVREDYSADGDAWNYFPHDHARSRAYRWNEDGLAGLCNRHQNLCLGIALWNGKDPFLKERLFGLNGHEGNHGEDVKEYYFYLDNTPTHSYMKMLYKYPQVPFPYQKLVEENQQRDRSQPDYELMDELCDVFSEGRYFDVFVEYAKAAEEDILCCITAVNRAPEAAQLHILPHLWYRNDWSWGYNRERPELRLQGPGIITTSHRHLGPRWWYADISGDEVVDFLFVENETNAMRLFGAANPSAFVKDGIHEAIVNQRMDRVNPRQTGSKAAAHYQRVIAPGESFRVRVRFTDRPHKNPFADFSHILKQRKIEAEQFYQVVQPAGLSDDQRLVQRQALAGLMWSKQFYHYSVELWLDGDPTQLRPPEERKLGRNTGWRHLYNLDVLSMPDKWEFPWHASWDLAFHAPAIALIDPEWAKRQLILLLREWYMHPNGQRSAYEWAFDDVNPPVHAWAAWQVYKITGRSDTGFLERVFHKLLLNFTWWVNHKDKDGNNVFQGGFLGMDNIGIFDRSAPLPSGGYLEQADGTAWMAFYSLNMLGIALELAQSKPAYEDIATKFFEHFVAIADAFYHIGGRDISLWDEKDGFFYDVLHSVNGRYVSLRVRSFIGLVPLLAVHILEPELLDKLPRFRRRMEWLLRFRPRLAAHVVPYDEKGASGHFQLGIVSKKNLMRILDRLFDPDEFLSEFGIRSLSRSHAQQPFQCQVGQQVYSVAYEPAESQSDLFGGNSNWRGPVWFTVNFLLIEALRKYHDHYGDTLLVEIHKGSGRRMTLDQAADELTRRLSRIFLKDEQNGGRRPVFGNQPVFQDDPHWRDYILFHEYFHGDNGTGLGASHQTGWTALIANLLSR